MLSRERRGQQRKPKFTHTGIHMARTLTDPFIRNHSAPEKRIEISDELADGLAIRITKTGTKSFVFRYRFGDTIKRYTIGRFPSVGLAKARDEAGELAYQVSKGIDPLKEKKARRSQHEKETSFKELTDRFIEGHLPTLRKRTRDEYERIIEKELLPALGKFNAKEVERQHIIKLLDNIAQKRDAPVLSNRVRAVLSSMYAFGIEKAIVEANPVLSVKRKKKTNKGEKVEKRRKRVYSPDEIQALWKAFSAQTEPVRSLFFMLLICGQRVGETRRMKWEYINWKDETWTIPAELTKAKREQVVPLTGLALDVLEALKKSAGKHPYVFPNRRHNDKPIEWVQQAVYRIRKQALVDEETKQYVDDFRVHDLRRTTATYLAELGTERTVLGKILNHKGLAGDDQVTAIYDRYDYLDEKRKALNIWSRRLQDIVSGKPETARAKIHAMK